MAKEKSSYSGEIVADSFSGELKQKRYRLSFQQNRTFELYVGGQMFRFPPGGAIDVDAWVIEHPDFKNHAGMFGVVEVTNG